MTGIYDDYGILITENHVFFYKNRCPFSNFYDKNVFKYSEDGNEIEFFCSEQFFMWKKAMRFNDLEIADKILEAKDPKTCKELGRSVRNYDDNVWNEIRYDVMLEANWLKFSQNEDLKRFLTDDKFYGKSFVEASPYDGIWGIKMKIGDEGIDDEKNWKGKNLLGQVLDEVRRLLIASDVNEDDIVTIGYLKRYLTENFNGDEKLAFWDEGGAWCECVRIIKSQMGHWMLHRVGDAKKRLVERDSEVDRICAKRDYVLVKDEDVIL